jgi:hypothetical protein
MRIYYAFHQRDGGGNIMYQQDTSTQYCGKALSQSLNTQFSKSRCVEKINFMVSSFTWSESTWFFYVVASYFTDCRLHFPLSGISVQ